MQRFGAKRAFVGFAIGLLALVVGVSVALAKSGPGQVRAPLLSDPTIECPPPDGHSYGKATLIRKKGVITVRVKLHGALPGKYILQLGSPDGFGGCDLVSPFSLDTFSVDASGDGEGSGTFVLTDLQDFAVGAFSVDTGGSYVTPLLKLGSS